MELAEVPTVEQCVKEDALEVQDIRELGLGWAWFVNDLRTFLPAWQDMELATPSAEEQVAGDVPVEPLPVHADATQLAMDLHTYEQPLAITPFGAQEHVPDWVPPKIAPLGLRLYWLCEDSWMKLNYAAKGRFAVVQQAK